MLPNSFAIYTAPDVVFLVIEPVWQLERNWVPALFVPTFPMPQCLCLFWPAARLWRLGAGMGPSL